MYYNYVCPVDGCEYQNKNLISTLHYQYVHGMTKEEVFAKYGPPLKIRMEKSNQYFKSNRHSHARTMRIGDVVRHRKDGIYGTVEYSTFGVSIHFWDDKALCKTLGDHASNIGLNWEVVDLPEGYEIHKEYGGVIKKEEKQ